MLLHRRLPLRRLMGTFMAMRNSGMLMMWAARALHRHRPASDLAMIVDTVRGTQEHAGLLEVGFAENAGVLRGRAGMLLAAAALWDGEEMIDGVRERFCAHESDLSLHFVEYESGLGVLGESALRLSLDYATGSAGVLHALARARGAAGDFPLLGGVAL